MSAEALLAGLTVLLLLCAGFLILVGWRASGGRDFSIYAYETGLRVVREKIGAWMKRSGRS
jgi:hypothetical protein